DPGSLGRDDSELGPGCARRQLDLEPGPQPALVRPDPGHRRTGVAGDHSSQCRAGPGRRFSVLPPSIGGLQPRRDPATFPRQMLCESCKARIYKRGVIVLGVAAATLLATGAGAVALARGVGSRV